MISKREEKKGKIRVGSNPISIAAIGCIGYPNLTRPLLSGFLKVRNNRKWC
jgi:hypothetical protein